MIRPININLNAAHPELPLVEATTFTGAPSSVFIRGVPKAVGNWSITAVSVAVTYPDNTTTARAAVESAEGVWVATIPGTATSGRTAAGFKIMADGIDENGAAVTGYVLGFADFSVLSFFPVPAPGETFFYLRYFDTMPTTAKKMDVTTIDGILKYYNGTAWLPFTDLSNYYTKAETDNAIERVAAYYITYNAAGAAFPTRADLINAQTYYSGGVVRVPTRNDYAVVLADETHDGAEWRYIYAVPDGETVGQWEAQYPVEGVIAYDDAVTRTSANGVKSSGIWSAIWGALSALPTGFSSLYDWCVSQIAKLRDKLDLNVYGYGNASVTFPMGYSITDGYITYRPGGTGGVDETITFIGPVPSSNQSTPNDKYYYPSSLGTLDSFDPNDYSVWCLVCDNGGTIPSYMMYKTGPYYNIGSFNSETPTLTLGFGEATGDAPTMARPIGATGDTLAKVSQIPAIVTPSTSASDSGKAADAKATGDALAGKLSTSGGTVAGTFGVAGSALPEFKVFEVIPSADGSTPTMRFSDGAGVVGIIWRLVSGYVVMDVSDYLGMTYRIALPSASGTLALTSAIPYALADPIVVATAQSEVVEGETVYYGAATLADRTANIVQVTAATALDELRITFPAAASGKVRDFGLRVEIGTGSAALTAPALVPIAPTGETIKIENNASEIPALADGTATAKGVTLLYFSENAPGVFVVKGEQVEEVA